MRRHQASALAPITAPETEHLKVEHDILLSSFAFKINLRRYSKVAILTRVMQLVHGVLARGIHGRAVLVDTITPV